MRTAGARPVYWTPPSPAAECKGIAGRIVPRIAAAHKMLIAVKKGADFL